MKVLKVIESKRWINKITKDTASIYGAVPYIGKADKDNWSIETVGYTWLTSDGTIGLGRKPVKTLEEAIKIMKLVNGE